ncbi:MAG TPA: polysaccharide biosynthesis tyrosine autokinase [Pseudomonadales bacterium]|nr:polysaccharide biosynthesis tyrosine autokinase [Pseudomonadales bacterium]
MASDNALMASKGQIAVVEENEIELNLRQYWGLLRKHQWRILGFSFVATSLAALVIFSLTSIYQAEATLLIESRDAKIVSIEEVYNLGGAVRNEYFFTQFEVLKSRELAEKVIAKLKLTENPIFNPPESKKGFLGLHIGGSATPPTEQEVLRKVVRKFASCLEVKPIRNTQLVTIAFETPDPVLSAEVINALAITYIESDLESRLDMTKQAATWLSSRMAGLRENLQAAENALQAYRDQEHLVDDSGVNTLASKEMNEIATKLVEARRKRSEMENIVAQIQGSQDYSALPAVLQQTLVQRLKETEAEASQKLDQLSKRYGPKHPKIIQAKSELDTARSSSSQQIGKVIEGIRHDYEIAKATEESLNDALEKKKTELQGINRKTYKLSELQRAVDVNRQLYDTFFSRVKETSETADLQTAHARVIDKAVPPNNPVKPRRSLLLFLSAFFSLLFGGFLACLKEILDNAIRNPDDVRTRLGQQILGLLPLMKDRRDSAQASQTFSQDPRCSFSESIRTIRTGVVLSGLDSPHKVLVVTSSVPGEGKTVVASNLSIAFGQMGKVLLIDADMRRPSVARSFGLPLSSPGLSNLVAGTAEVSLCIHRREDLGIDIIPSGLVPPNPLELLSSKRFAAAIAALEKKYDRIIIDSAPCEVVSDALVLSTFANALIYVVKADSTNGKSVRSGIERLRQVGAPLTGVVLNQVDIEKGLRYGGYYYGGYYDQYGYSSAAKST